MRLWTNWLQSIRERARWWSYVSLAVLVLKRRQKLCTFPLLPSCVNGAWLRPGFTIHSAMNPERWQQLDKLFHLALERAPDDRASFLDEACVGDQQLKKEIEALIAANEQSGSFIEKPAFQVEARSVANEQRDSIAESMVGKTIGHYRVIALLGS